jgi:hypothetical protein
MQYCRDVRFDLTPWRWRGTLEGPRAQIGMKARYLVAILVGAAAMQANVSALTTPKESDGPIRLLSCVVSGNGTLEAEVDNQSDDAMSCYIRCNYEIGEKTFSHGFQATIPKHFNGRVGGFDTQGGRAGSYSGDVGACTKSPAR